MQEKKLPRPQRRALNIIWTAAGDYSFTPSFTAFWQDGEPDFYMNSIIGYVHKWYDPDIMGELFDQINRSFLRETLDGLLWVALESCAYERESAQRPVLSEMRLRHAETFFAQELSRSRQQWMAQNSLVYALQAARCRLVLGKEAGLVNPWERRLFADLQYDGAMTAQEIRERTLQVFRRYFPILSSPGRPSVLAGLRQKLRRFLLRRLPSRLVRTDTLLMTGVIPGEGRVAEGRRGLDVGRQNPAVQKADLLYIEGCFGKPLYTEEEWRRIEDELCRDAHARCHLYFTDGQQGAAPSPDTAVQKVRRDAAAQMYRNKAHFQSRYRLYRASITRLSEQIRSSLLVYPQPIRVRSRSGALFPSRIWRGLYLDDPRVFMDTLDESEADFSVDLMLDASASRLQSQEIIAAQGYVIARSLQLCRIPVQVFSFLSVRGYTVLQRFVDYSQTDPGQAEHIFRYFAAGWNRDGLALRGAGRLMEDSPARNRLLIVLTDASPNDDRRIPATPAGSSRRLVSQDYSGQAGVKDTAAEVRALRKKGVYVCGILTGADGDTRAAREIFGNDFVRIEKMERFSEAAGVLIQQQIQKLTLR